MEDQQSHEIDKIDTQGSNQRMGSRQGFMLGGMMFDKKAKVQKEMQGMKDAAMDSRLDKELGVKTSEAEKQRSFLGGENSLDRDYKASEATKGREHDATQLKRTIAGRAFTSGLAGDQAQQIQNSFDGDVDYRGLKMPSKEKPSNAYKPLYETDEEGQKSFAGAFNQQTGERKPVIGGTAMGNDQNTRNYLLNLKKKNPEEYERLKREARGRY